MTIAFTESYLPSGNILVRGETVDGRSATCLANSCFRAVIEAAYQHVRQKLEQEIDYDRQRT